MTEVREDQVETHNLRQEVEEAIPTKEDLQDPIATGILTIPRETLMTEVREGGQKSQIEQTHHIKEKTHLIPSNQLES